MPFSMNFAHNRTKICCYCWIWKVFRQHLGRKSRRRKKRKKSCPNISRNIYFFGSWQVRARQFFYFERRSSVSCGCHLGHAEQLLNQGSWDVDLIAAVGLLQHLLKLVLEVVKVPFWQSGRLRDAMLNKHWEGHVSFPEPGQLDQVDQVVGQRVDVLSQLADQV